MRVTSTATFQLTIAMTLNLLNQPVSAQPGPLADTATATFTAAPTSKEGIGSNTVKFINDQKMLARLTGLREGTQPKWSDVVSYVHELRRQKKKPHVITTYLRMLADIYDSLYPGPPFWNPFFQAGFSLFFARELQLPRSRPNRPA